MMVMRIIVYAEELTQVIEVIRKTKAVGPVPELVTALLRKMADSLNAEFHLSAEPFRLPPPVEVRSSPPTPRPVLDLGGDGTARLSGRAERSPQPSEPEGGIGTALKNWPKRNAYAVFTEGIEGASLEDQLAGWKAWYSHKSLEAQGQIMDLKKQLLVKEAEDVTLGAADHAYWAKITEDTAKRSGSPTDGHVQIADIKSGFLLSLMDLIDKFGALGLVGVVQCYCKSEGGLAILKAQVDYLRSHDPCIECGHPRPQGADHVHGPSEYEARDLAFPDSDALEFFDDPGSATLNPGAQGFVVVLDDEDPTKASIIRAVVSEAAATPLGFVITPTSTTEELKAVGRANGNQIADQIEEDTDAEIVSIHRTRFAIKNLVENGSSIELAEQVLTELKARGFGDGPKVTPANRTFDKNLFSSAEAQKAFFECIDGGSRPVMSAPLNHDSIYWIKSDAERKLY